MEFGFTKEKNYSFKDYILGETLVRYIVMDSDKKTFFTIVPKECSQGLNDEYKTTSADSDFPDNRDWLAGSLVHLHLSHHVKSPFCEGYKLGQAYDDMYFCSQKKTDYDDKSVIETVIKSDEGYEAKHILTYYFGETGFEVKTVFSNHCGKDVNLEYITSASLDNLSPYMQDDGSKDIVYHAFKSAWALEGKHIEKTLPEMNMEKSWGGSYENYRIGSKGSRATANYYPYAALEDKKSGVIWGISLAHNATWQIDLSRYASRLSLSCSIGDFSYGAWFKTVRDGESFETPTAYIASVKGSIAEISDAMLKIEERAADIYGEEGMPITFNDWCTTWGDTSHKNMLAIAEKIKNTKVKYLVIDAGWYDGTVGDWTENPKTFPYGMKAYTDEIRKMNFIPGIWMEFECTSQGCKLYGKRDDMHVKYDGNVVYGQVNKSRRESFLDFTNPDVIDYLDKAVIGFLKDNGFGYLKIDYNANIGIGCDGAESKGEGLRLQMQAVREFIKRIKEKIPDIIIEDCASGGMRHDASMLGVCAMCSFSDAHECFEFPIVAANLHYLVPPRQIQIWNVLKPWFDDNRFAYTVSAGFLGRICWSGDFLGLSDEQMDKIYKAEAFYDKVSEIIKHGISYIYRTDTINYRYPTGTQAVLRYSDDRKSALLVYQCFKDVKKLEIELNENYEISEMLYEANVSCSGKKFTIDDKKEVFGNVIYLKKSN